MNHLNKIMNKIKSAICYPVLRVNGKISNQNLLKSILIIILAIGCLWQVETISEFYFNYPTNVFIETKFDAIRRQMPAISFCHFHENANNSDQVFEKYNIEGIFLTSISNSEDQYRNLSNDFWPNKIEIVTRDFYCFTLNSGINGNLYDNGHFFEKLIIF